VAQAHGRRQIRINDEPVVRDSLEPAVFSASKPIIGGKPMRLRSLIRRRPSPALVIASVALFVALGGVGYAATQLPPGSVGTAQLRTNAVTYTKIRPNSIGWQRANTTTLQVRVSGNCLAGSAIGAIQQYGNVTCNSTAPSQFGTTNNSATVPSTATTVTSETLPSGGSYLALANPTAIVTSGATSQHVTVTCTLSVASNTETRTVTVDTNGTSGQQSSSSIPLQATGPSGTASVSCQSSSTGATAPTVTVTSALNALQIAG
jgi:hypothetical protein